jgi:hypothetical protein
MGAQSVEIVIFSDAAAAAKRIEARAHYFMGIASLDVELLDRRQNFFRHP